MKVRFRKQKGEPTSVSVSEATRQKLRQLDSANRHGGRFSFFCIAAFFSLTTFSQENSPYQRLDLHSASGTAASRAKDWKPGDGITLEASGLEWLGGDAERLAVSIRKGEVWFIDNVLSAKTQDDTKFTRFAHGLHEPLGLLRDGDDLLVAQRAEITRLRDKNGDDSCDSYLTEGEGWNVSGNYHAYVYGPERDGNGDLWVTLNLGMGNLANNKIGWRGWGGTLVDGKFQPKAFGMRSPSGFGPNLEGDLFFTDQQGTWIPATPIYHLRPGVFYGNQESAETLKSPDAPFKMDLPKPNQPYPDALRGSKRSVPPAVWLPYNKVGRSGTDVRVIDTEKFGPFHGQLLTGEFTNASVNRVFLEKVNGQYQGACFRFLERFPAAVLRLEFASDGSLFVGMSNRGWSSLGNRSYGLQRVRFSGKPIFAIKEMRAKPDGFELEFTEPIDPTSVKKSGVFAMRSFTYEYSSRYGGDEVLTKPHNISEMTLIDEKTVRLKIEGLREFFVHELETNGLVSEKGQPLDWPKAWYTLNAIPTK